MNTDALVDRITQEVLEVYRRKGKETQVAGAPLALGDYPLVGVCGNPLARKDAEKAFATLRATHPRLKVLLSPQAERLFHDSRRLFGGLTIDPSARDYTQTLARFSSLTILNTSVNFVAKLAMLLADTPLTVATFEFLAAGKPVYLTTAALEPYLSNGAIRSRVDAYLLELTSYGIQLSRAHEPAAASSAPTLRVLTPPPGLKKSECGGCPVPGQCVSHCEPRADEMVSLGVVRIGSVPGTPAPGNKLASLIDHTMLKPDATDAEVRKLCEEAAQYKFASVCINPSKVKLSAELLRGTGVKVCTVVGFPLGATTSFTKETETRDAVANGADEIDMVINIGALKAKDHDRVREDIEAVVRAAGGRIVKVIFETALLNDEEKVAACKLSKEAGADFVKTSTGFGGGGATVHDIELMRRTVGPEMGVKASGGIRDFETARKMVEAGATRIGASASVAIVKNPEAKAEGKGY